MNKNGLTLIEVVITFTFLIIFIGSIFTMLGYISKNSSINSIQLAMSDILHNNMEEVKVKMNTDISIAIKESGKYAYIENGNEYSVENTVAEVSNKEELYKIFIEIKKEGENLKDNMASYYFNLISYEPQYYNEIPITTEDIHGLNFKDNNE